jgi:archaellum biogenesis ATPase FlaH
MELAIREIKSASKEGRNISDSELSKKTGLSKGFFYKNEEVRAVLDEIKREQDIEQMTEIRKEIKQYSLEKQNEIYRIELENLKRENEELKKENQKLEKALVKTRLEYLKLL